MTPEWVRALQQDQTCSWGKTKSFYCFFPHVNSDWIAKESGTAAAALRGAAGTLRPRRGISHGLSQPPHTAPPVAAAPRYVTESISRFLCKRVIFNLVAVLSPGPVLAGGLIYGFQLTRVLAKWTVLL